MKMTLKTGPPLQIFILSPSPPHEKITWNFSWWLLTLTATPQLMLNRKWYQASKPEMEFHMMNTMYAALPMHAQTEKMTFSCKDDYTLKKSSWCWTYSALQYLFYLYSVSLGDALTTAKEASPVCRSFLDGSRHFLPLSSLFQNRYYANN